MKNGYLIFCSILCLVFCFKTASAQTDSASNAIHLLNVRLANQGSSSMVYTYNDRYDGIEGNRFFYDDQYHTGELWMNENKHFTTEYKYKFDQLAGTVQVMGANGREILLEIRDVMIFKMFIDDKTITYARFVLPKTQEFALLQVIYYSQNMRLLRNTKKKLIRQETQGTYTESKVYDTVVNDYSYYFAEKEDPLTLFKPSKKGFIKAMPRKEKAIEKLLKTTAFKGDLTVSKLTELMQKLDAE